MTIQRSTRVLAHPDGSFTVEFLAEGTMVDQSQPMAIPQRIKRWAVDPGFAPQPGLVGQHAVLSNAQARAHALAHTDGAHIFCTFSDFTWRDEDLPKGMTIQ